MPITYKDVIVSAITLYSVLTFFESRGEAIESRQKTGKSTICFLMVVELRSSLQGEILGINAICPVGVWIF
jgi:hypothetical protein